MSSILPWQIKYAENTKKVYRALYNEQIRNISSISTQIPNENIQISKIKNHSFLIIK